MYELFAYLTTHVLQRVVAFLAEEDLAVANLKGEGEK